MWENSSFYPKIQHNKQECTHVLYVAQLHFAWDINTHAQEFFLHKLIAHLAVRTRVQEEHHEAEEAFGPVGGDGHDEDGEETTDFHGDDHGVEDQVDFERGRSCRLDTHD